MATRILPVLALVAIAINATAALATSIEPRALTWNIVSETESGALLSIKLHQ